MQRGVDTRVVCVSLLAVPRQQSFQITHSNNSKYRDYLITACKYNFNSTRRVAGLAVTEFKHRLHHAINLLDLALSSATSVMTRKLGPREWNIC
jgi:hypothetical protein